MNKFYTLILAIFFIFHYVAFTKYSHASELVSYFHLRFELTTTSSVCQLLMKSGTHILSCRQIRISGAPMKAGISLQRLWVASFQAGQPIGITGDFAIAPEAMGQSFPCQFIHAMDGMSDLRVYVMKTHSDSVLLHEIKSFTSDTLNFSIDLSPLRGMVPLQKMITPIAPQKLLCAFYYPWYFIGDWNSNLLQDRPTTRYSSDDSVAIERHVLQAKRAGIDVFLSSWWGPDGYTDSNLGILLNVAQRHQFRVAINFETLTTDPVTQETVPLDDATIFSWLKYAITHFGAHPAYLKVDHKPVFVLWASTAVSDSSWWNIFEQLKNIGKEAVYIAMFSGEDPPINRLEIFDGFHTYNILGVIQRNDQVPTILSRVYTNFGKVLHCYPLLTDKTTKIWAATVQPGYDDHLIPGRTTPILPRENGNLYRNTFAAALNSNPDWIFITTWNEWWEHTYIEPSESYGDQYLELTKEYAELWKGHPVIVREMDSANTSEFSLQQNYLNPFNSSTVISFRLPFRTHVTLRVFDLLGREVQRLVDGVMEAGEYRVLFDARDLSSGMYVYHIKTEFYEEKRKALLIK